MKGIGKTFVLIIWVLFVGLILSSAKASANSTWVVKFHKPLSKKDKNNLSKIWRSKITKFDQFRSPYFDRLYYVSTKKDQYQLASHPLVAKVESIDKIIQPFSVEKSGQDSTLTNDPLLGYQWAIDNTGQIIRQDITDIKARIIVGPPQADIDLSNLLALDQMMKKDVVIAIVDSGVDIGHPDLKNNIFKNEKECVHGEPPIKATEDLDQNGYKGDCKGVNLTGKDMEFAHRVTDETGHGTHLAGIIAASVNNGIGITGISNRLKILPIKVLKSDKDNKENKNALSITDRLAKGILYAVQMKADVINLSLGWPLAVDKEYLQQALEEAYKADILVVAAAGNNNHQMPIIPCAREHVLCVGALKNDDTIADYSNFGLHVDVLAPGDNILSLAPMNFKPDLFAVTGYDLKHGTSQAAPYVSALAGVLRGIWPERSSEDIQDLIRLSSRTIQTQKKSFLAGAISFDRALRGVVELIPLPSFKENSRLIYSTQEPLMRYTFPVRNPGTKPQSLKISVESKNPGLQIVEMHYPRSLGPKETQSVSFHLRLSDSQIESSVELSIKINDHPYLLQLTLHRNLKDDPSVWILSAPELKTPNLLTLPVRQLPSENPSFYTQQFENKQLTLQFFEPSETQLRIQKNLVIRDLDAANQFVSIHQMDVDQDGEADYQVQLIRKVDNVSRLFYLNFDSQLQPKKVFSEIRLVDEGVVQIDTQLSYVYFQTPEGKISVPVFVSSGPTPTRDQPRDLYEPRDTQNRSHIYFFMPEKDPKGNWVYSTRIMDSRDQLKVWEKQLKVRLFGDVRLLHIFPQSDQERQSNTVRILVSYGYDFDRKTGFLYAHLNAQNTWEFRWDLSAVTDRVVDGYRLQKIMDLDSGDVNEVALLAPHADAFWEKLNLTDTYSSSFITALDGPDPSEHFVIFKKGYKSGDLRYSFIMTLSEYLFTIEQPSGVQYFRRPYHVSTFLPGYLFDEIAVPIWVKSQAKYLPALYVDGSKLVARELYSIIGLENGARAPAHLNVVIPDNCISRQPNLWHKRDYYYTLLCQNRSTNSWDMHLIPVSL